MAESGPKVPKEFILIFGRYQQGVDVILDSVKVTALPFSQEFNLKGKSRGLYFLQISHRGQGVNRAEFLGSASESGMVVETDYWGLMNGFVAITGSTENEAYGQLITAKGIFDEKLSGLEMRLRSLSPFDKDFNRNTKLIVDSINKVIGALNFDLKVVRAAYKGTFCAQVMVPMTLHPSHEWNTEWAKEYDSYFALMNEHYLDSVPITPEALNHYALEDKIAFYLDRYTMKSTDGAQKGIDVIMRISSGNEEVRSHVFNMLLRNFLNFKTETLAKYLLDNYADGCTMKLSVEEFKRLSSMKAAMVGGRIPELNLPDRDGKRKSLHDYAATNRYTVVFVWLSWCAMCQREIPKLQDLFGKWQKKGLGVYAISLDEKREDWLVGLDNKWRFNHPNVSELVPIKSSSVANMLGISTTPKVFILNNTGEIVAKDLYGESLKLKLEELFASSK
jgi:thiol-disulfide isomerase/thioredoxin